MRGFVATGAAVPHMEWAHSTAKGPLRMLANALRDFNFGLGDTADLLRDSVVVKTFTSKGNVLTFS